MDAEALANCDAYQRHRTRLIEIQEMADRWEAKLYGQVDEMARSPERWRRRRAKVHRKGVDRLVNSTRQRIQCLFDQLDDFDPALGTFSKVQQEAADELAAIFG